MTRVIGSLILAGVVLCSCTTTSSDRSSLSTSDLQAITALRTALVEAITAGDAAEYAALCTEDVQLLHPNAPLVTGRADLEAHNAAIFDAVKVINLVLSPVVVSGAGDLAYEVGTQELVIEPSMPGFRSTRKYVHVLKRGTDGVWRFAVLMSNDS